MKRPRIAHEDGIALIMALGIMLVLTIMLISIVGYTSSSARHASRSKAGQTSYALAESGVNNAIAVLSQRYPSTTLGDSSWLSQRTDTYSGGTVTWSGTFVPNAEGYRGVWTITSTGSVQNPTGPNTSPLTRTITAKVDVYERPVTVNPPSVWNFVYSGGLGQTCDMTIDQSVAWTSPLYVAGNLCLRNTAEIAQPTGGTGDRVIVGGSLDQINKQNTVGTVATPLSGVRIAGSCHYWTKAPSGPPCNVNNNNTKVFVQAGQFNPFLPSPPIAAPTIDWQAMYDRASPGPYSPCVTTSGTPPTFDNDQTLGPSGGSVGGVFNLTGASYTCRTLGGELSWDNAAKVLTIRGIVFIDGSAEINTGNGVISKYDGFGVIYLRGTLLIQNNTTLCALKNVGGTNCDFATWDGSQAMLTIAAYGSGNGQVSAGNSVEVNQSVFQGALYGANNIQVANTSNVQGPMVSPNVVAPGQSGALGFPLNILINVGTPGDPTLPSYTIGPPRDVTY